MEKDLIKAKLIAGGDVRLPKGFDIPFRLSRSTAGPGAGKTSMAFEFGGMRVKKGVSFTGGEFELREDNGTLSIWAERECLVPDVKIIPIVYHAPGQAFFNLDQRCMFRCAFCASPLLGTDAAKNLTDEKIASMIKDADNSEHVPSIALTSGVAGSVDETINRMVSCVARLRREFPEKIIGVEPYVNSKDHIERLKSAGADEIKINREAARKDIFDKVCPDLDYDMIFDMIRHAADIFGPGKVTSNIIYGMGETDNDVIEEIERLASIGCVPGLRAIKIGILNRSSIANVIGTLDTVTPDRMVRLAKEQKRVLEKHGLTTKTFGTMCFECQCCDLVPFRDL